MTYILGLTGGIASGKSTISNILAGYGACIIDGDQVARELQQPGTVGLCQIENQFGSRYLNDDGSLNRGLLGELVFNHHDQLEKLNQIMRPLIHKKIVKILQQAQSSCKRLIVIDMALLFEGSYDQMCTSTMVVKTTPERQLANLMKRNHLSRDEAEARINSQMSNLERSKMADEIILNNGSVEDLKLKMLKWLQSKHLLESEVD